MTPPPLDCSVEVEISDTQAHVSVDAEWLRNFALAVLEGEGISAGTVSIAVVDNATIHDLNRRHLGHDWPTDVISFRLSEDDEPVLAAELIVSGEMAATTARDAGVDPLFEVALYVAHGLLHVCGYDDTSEEAAATMRKREDEVLARQGVLNTFGMVEPGPAAEPGQEIGR